LESYNALMNQVASYHAQLEASMWPKGIQKIPNDAVCLR
jgi:hypothetical protein